MKKAKYKIGDKVEIHGKEDYICEVHTSRDGIWYAVEKDPWPLYREWVVKRVDHLQPRKALKRLKMPAENF